MTNTPNPRKIKRIVANYNSNNIVTSVTVTISGGNTSGAHMPSFRDGEYNCDCIGFMSHGRCRHIMLVRDIKDSLQDIGSGVE